MVSNNGTHFYHDSGQSGGKEDFILGKAKDLLGCDLLIFWTIIDPKGVVNVYSAEAVVIQNNVECDTHQIATGKTNAAAAHYANHGLFIKLVGGE